jgi:hypothetical protein
MIASGYRTIRGYTYKCDKLDRTFTFNSEDKYQIHQKYHRKKCDYCNNKKNEFIEKNMIVDQKNVNLANTNELQKLLRDEYTRDLDELKK